MTRSHHDKRAPRLSAATITWLSANAEDLDAGGAHAFELSARLAEAGLVRFGIPAHLGGDGGTISDAVSAVAAVSFYSLAAGFVLWSQRTYAEILLRSESAEMREQLLPAILSGRLAGATALANAIKFLAGLEELQITARPDRGQLVLDGKMPWVTNLAPSGFHVAAAVSVSGGAPIIVSLAHNDTGLTRSRDLDLIGLRATNTAAIAVTNVRIGRERIIANAAWEWLPHTRPRSLGLQCGMSLGLARRALREAREASGPGRGVLVRDIAELADRLDRQENALLDGLISEAFVANPAEIFRLRIALAESVAQAICLELQAIGGRAYIASPEQGFARRLREAAFIPIVTPSLVQLKTMLVADDATKAEGGHERGKGDRTRRGRTRHQHR